MTYVLCPDSGSCTTMLCGPLVAFKQNGCVQYEKAGFGTSSKLVASHDHSDEENAPDQIAGFGNEPRIMAYPNPFSDQTDFTFVLTQPAEIRIKLFTVAGRLVRDLVGV